MEVLLCDPILMSLTCTRLKVILMKTIHKPEYESSRSPANCHQSKTFVQTMGTNFIGISLHKLTNVAEST